MINQTIKTIIIDDEHMARDLLRLAIEEQFPLLEIIGEGGNVDEAADLIRKHQPQLVFLDIHMPGKSGFELFNLVEDRINFEVVFVTGFSNYMIEAFQVSAIGYLLKPLDKKQLAITIHNAIKRIKQQQFAQRYQTFIDNKKNIGTDKMKIVLSGKDGLTIIQTHEIIRCEGWDKYTYIYTTDNTKHLSTKNIGTYKQILEPIGFFITHKSHIINTKFISSFNNKNDNILMKDGAAVPLARRRKSSFLALLKRD